MPEATGPVWFQLYVYKDREATLSLVDRAVSSGCTAIALTIDALPPLMDAVDGKMEVLIDGGIRRGTDVFKAIALGAKAVGVGRPIIWGLAVDGEQGAKRVLDILRKDFELTMRLCGCATIEDINKDLLF
jgi:4-hydroxymandelate oxidase